MGRQLEWCWEGPWAGLARPPCTSGVDLLGEKRDLNQRPPLPWTQAPSSGLECSESWKVRLRKVTAESVVCGNADPPTYKLCDIGVLA